MSLWHSRYCWNRALQHSSSGDATLLGMQQHRLETKYADPDTLTTHPDNPRRGDLEELKQSLLRSGQYKPIVVNTRSGYVIAGNHTLMAVRLIGWDKIAYVEIDVDEKTATRILLADNRIGQKGGFDGDLLIEHLEFLDEDLVGTGYDETDLELLKHTDDDIDTDDPEGDPVLTFGVVIEVDSLSEQITLLQQLHREGLDARPLHK